MNVFEEMAAKTKSRAEEQERLNHIFLVFGAEKAKEAIVLSAEASHKSFSQYDNHWRDPRRGWRLVRFNRDMKAHKFHQLLFAKGDITIAYDRKFKINAADCHVFGRIIAYSTRDEVDCRLHNASIIEWLEPPIQQEGGN